MSSIASPGLREKKRRQALDHIALTAAHLFEAHGFEAVTMEQIAAEAEVAKGTLYKHFPAKEAVLAHWIHAVLEADMARMAPELEPLRGFVERARHVLRASAAWFEAYRHYLPAYLRFRFADIGAAAPAGDRRPSDIADLFAFIIARGQEAGEIRSDMEAAQLASQFHHLYFGALMRWLTVPGLDLQREFDAVVLLFMQGAGPRPAGPRGRSHKR